MQIVLRRALASNPS